MPTQVDVIKMSELGVWTLNVTTDQAPDHLWYPAVGGGNWSVDASTHEVTTGGDGQGSNQTSPSPSTSSSPDMLTRFMCETGLALPVSVLGTVGNLLAVIVLQKQRQRISTTLLLQTLAVSDTAVLLSTVLLRSLRYLYYYTHWSILGPYMGVYNYVFIGLFPLVYFIRLTGTWITVLLTIDRYIAVRFPLHAHHLCTTSRAMRHVIVLALFALLFSLPRFFEYQIDNKNKFGFSSTALLVSRTYTIVYRIVLFFAFMYLIPMLLLIILNAHLLITLKVADTYRAGVSDSKNVKTNRNITATVVTVVLVTIVCNVSAMLSHLLWSLQQCFTHLAHLDSSRRYLALISNVFITLNSAINFMIYCLCSRNFRAVLFQMCSCGRHRREGRHLRIGRGDTTSVTFQTSVGSANYIPLTASSMLRKSRNENGGTHETASRTYQ